MKKQDPKTGRFVRTKPDYKAMYEKLQNEASDLEDNVNFWKNKCAGLEDDLKVTDGNLRNATLAHNEARRIIDKQKEEIAFLLDHCSFWVRWMYKRHFKK